MGAPNLVPDNMDNSLSYSVITYLKSTRELLLQWASIIKIQLSAFLV
jgi:hypothetical protein